MNIIARPYGRQQGYCRPDTTWERENKDFYSPECVNDIYWAPILFVRISKAGKCISGKFASRYYDGFNFGALIYCHTGEGSYERAYTSCLDHTSLLPFPLYNPVVMENEENTFELLKGGEKVFEAHASKEFIEDAICKASARTSLRIGDMVAVELAPLSLMASKEDGKTPVKGIFCENTFFEFDVIF